MDGPGARGGAGGLIIAPCNGAEPGYNQWIHCPHCQPTTGCSQTVRAWLGASLDAQPHTSPTSPIGHQHEPCGAPAIWTVDDSVSTGCTPGKAAEAPRDIEAYFAGTMEANGRYLRKDGGPHGTFYQMYLSHVILPVANSVPTVSTVAPPQAIRGLSGRGLGPSQVPSPTRARGACLGGLTSRGRLS